MSVEAILFAVDHVRVRVAIVTPGAYPLVHDASLVHDDQAEGDLFG